MTLTIHVIDIGKVTAESLFRLTGFHWIMYTERLFDKYVCEIEDMAMVFHEPPYNYLVDYEHEVRFTVYDDGVNLWGSSVMKRPYEPITTSLCRKLYSGIWEVL